MPPELETLRLAEAEGVLTIELHRPERLNALTEQVARDLRAALEHAARDEIRAVVLTGAGRAFSSGADLRSMGSPGDDGRVDLARSLREHFNAPVRALRDLPKPVVAAVNGPAAGIGCSLALACDLVVARESAYLLLAFANIGLVPDGGSSLLVPARAGFTRAAEMALLAERIPARQALEWGLVNRVLADADFDAGIDALAERLATGPTRAYAGAKRQLNAWLFGGMEEQLALEAGLQQEMAASADFAEGVQAFLARRPPEFRGA